MNILKDKKMLRLSFPYDAEKVELCKLLGTRFNKQRRDWFFKDNFMNRQCLCRVFPGLISPPGRSGNNELTVHKYLMDHQGQALRRAAKHDRWGIYHDTGVGKTITALEVYLHHGVKTLVVCPLSLIEGAWIEEIRNPFAAIKESTPELEEIRGRYRRIKVSNLWTAKKRSPIAFNKALEKDFCIINYESFRTVDKRLAGAGFEMVIIDESSRIRTPKKGSTSDKVIEFCDDVQYVYELSGVPAPNSLLNYWTQIRILDPLLWSKSYYKFRAKYFYPSGYGGYDWQVKPEYEQKIIDDICTVAEYVSKEDVLDLPERTDSLRIFQLSSEERKHFKNIKAELITILDDGEKISSPNAVTAIQKLRQLSSGFLLDDKHVHKIGTSKLREFSSLIEDIGKKQVIVWINFKHEAVQVAEALKKMGCECGILNSTVTEKQKQEYLRAFKGGNLQYIACHPKSVGFGHTLTNCTEAIYYGYSYSYDESHQSRDRIYRKTQEGKCSYYYLVADLTLDMPILKTVRKKGDSSQAILDFLKRG